MCAVPCTTNTDKRVPAAGSCAGRLATCLAVERVAPSATHALHACMTAQLLADAQRVLRSCASGSAAQLAQQVAQRSLAQQVAHRLLELKARCRYTSKTRWLSPRSPEASLSVRARLCPEHASASLGQSPRPDSAILGLFSTQAPLRVLLAGRAALRVRRAARAGAAAARAAHLHRRPAAGARQPGEQHQAAPRRLPGQRSLGGKHCAVPG